MKLADVMTSDDVALDVEARGGKGVFERFAQIASRHHAVGIGAVLDGLLDREQLGSTALGHGVAIPHCRLRQLKTPVAGLVRLRAGIEFGAPDGQPAVLFAILLVPELATETHLELLASIAGLLSDKAQRQRLLVATTEADAYRVIAEAPRLGVTQP